MTTVQFCKLVESQFELTREERIAALVYREGWTEERLRSELKNTLYVSEPFKNNILIAFRDIRIDEDIFGVKKVVE